MPLLEVASLVDDFNIGPITAQRRTAPTQNSYGVFVPAAPVNVILNPCVIHEASGRVLNQLPEADRNTQTIEVYTRGQRLYVADDNRPPDVVLYQGRSYRVSVVDDYLLAGGVYFALAVLEDPQA